MTRLSILLVTLLLMSGFASGALAIQYIAPLNGANQSFGSSNLVFLDNTNGRVGIANVAPGVTFDITGTGRFSSTLTATNGFTLSGGALTLPSGSITTAMLADGAITSLKHLDSSINSTKLNSTNSAGAGQYLTYGSAGQFTWTTLPTGNSGNITPGAGSTLGNVAFWNNGSMLNGTTNLFWDSANRRLGINTAVPAQALTVVGNVSLVNGSLSATPPLPSVVGTVADSQFLNVIDSVAVQGKYAYVTATTNDTFSIFDISVPSAPVRLSTIGKVGLSTFNGASGVVVNGQYAYVAAGASDVLSVVDISDPLNPRPVGKLTDSTNIDNIKHLALVGNTIFATARDGDRVAAIDVSNPFSPTLISTTGADSTNTNYPYDIAVQGRYAYVTSRFDSTDNTSAFLSIFDVSDPTNMTRQSTVTSANLNDSRGVYVSGRYAYVVGFVSKSLVIFDVSNVTAPVEVGSLTDATTLNGPQAIIVVGRYAYIVSSGGDCFTIVDVSNPASPVVAQSITSSTTLDGAIGIAMSGRYAYVAASVDDMLSVVDLGNELPTLYAGSLGAGSLTVDDYATVGNSLQVGGSANIGGSLMARDGITTYYDSVSSTAGNERAANIMLVDNGSVSTSTDNTYGIVSTVNRTGPSGGTINTYGGYFNVTADTGGTSTATGVYSVVSGADTNYAGIFTGGSVGIGTTQPNSTLHVGGTANITGTLYAGGAFSTASTVTASGLITGSNGLTITGTVTLPTGSVTSAYILDGTIIAADLASDSVTSLKVINAGINVTKLNTSNAGSAGQVLMLNTTGGLNWSSTSAGTVTSVAQAVTGTTAVSVSGSPVTTSGTLSLAFVNATGSQDGLLKSADFTTFTNAAALATALYTNISNLQNSNASAFVAINALNASVISRGNWTQDKPNYALITYVNSAGNWTQDKSSYSTTANSNSMYQARFGVGVANQALIWLNSTNATARLINSTFINTTNTPSSGQYLTYGGSSNGQFTWTTLPASAGNVSSTNGTSGYIARFTNSTNIATGSLYDSGTAVGIGDTTPTNKLDVAGAIGISDTTIIDASRNIVNAGSGTFSGAIVATSAWPSIRANTNAGSGAVLLGRTHSEGGEIEFIDSANAAAGWIQGSTSGNLRFVDAGWTRTTFNVDGSGHADASQFRDIENTAYYLDPASSSIINGLTTAAPPIFSTSSSGAAARTVTILESGDSQVNYGSYTGSWRSALQIQGNDPTYILHIAPPESDYGYSIIRSTAAGLKVDVGGTTGTSGTNAITVDTSGNVVTPVSLGTDTIKDSGTTTRVSFSSGNVVVTVG